MLLIYFSPLNACVKKTTKLNMKITIVLCNEINKSTSHTHITTNQLLIEAILSTLSSESDFVRMGFYSFDRRVTEMIL